MIEAELRYGTESLNARFERGSIDMIGKRADRAYLSDSALGETLDSQVGSSALEEIAHPGETVLIVVPDATRQSGAGQVSNLLVRRLIASGTMPYDIGIIFATGIHRPVTEAEKAEIVTPFVAQRIKALDHRPRDLMQTSRLGETSGGIPVELNRALLDFDKTITVGAVAYHYFAGFTGGRKLVCPGLASSRTIAGSHKLAFDFERMGRADGVGMGMLEGNPVHKAFVEAAAFAPPSFSVNTIVDDAGHILDAVCGEWKESHESACRKYAADHEVRIPEKRPFVAVSAGGWPFDINLIQAHKALEAASRACEDGGTIVLFAECAEGTGRRDFLDWFDAGSSKRLAERLADSYQVNGQTAWSLLEKTERFDVKMVTSLPDEPVSRMGMTKIGRDDAMKMIADQSSGYLLPFGAKFLPVVDSPS
jgi:nickel-dependent lactate racemase